MSRARNIKPGFFKNDLLAECHPLARILFAGLWCEADREGRLEDRPARIKVECLPYDECDIHELLDALSQRNFITRYEAAGKRYIAINEFLVHQNPHQREVPSVIPAPPCTEHNLGDAQAQPRLDLAEDCTGSARLFPLSPFPHPDSSQKQRGAKAPALTLPEWLPESAWADWHKFRNSRKGWTPKARELSLATLTKLRTKGHDPTAVIEQSIERGWTGLFEIKNTVNNDANHQSGRKLSAVEQVEQAIRERRARESGDDSAARIGHG